MADIFAYKSDEIEAVFACPWCSSVNRHAWAEPNRDFPSVKCDTCGVVFLNRRLNEKGRKRFYNSYIRLHETPERLEQRLKMYKIEYNLISNIVTRGRILDVGCGSGKFIAHFPSERYERFGVEYGKESAEAFRKLIGPERFYEGGLLDIDFQKSSFDLIVFRGVLEHMSDPRHVLEKACSLTKKEGFIFITSMPNLECICADIYRSSWTQHREFEHIIHFGKSHFRAFFRDKGFVEIIDKDLYWDTPYANPQQDILEVAEAIKKKKEGVSRIEKVSPPFWGSVLSMVFKKVND